MHPIIIFSYKMDFSQNNLFGYIEDLQELTIIERPVRRSLKTPEEIERLTVDEELNDIERAVYLLRLKFNKKDFILLKFKITFIWKEALGTDGLSY
uniref:Uncharacterized protein n=1 Tax=Anolis carolinensis TaxID=28377 RepID=A0A803U0U6_ANOCA